jgi:hypothetical protein
MKPSGIMKSLSFPLCVLIHTQEGGPKKTNVWRNRLTSRWVSVCPCLLRVGQDETMSGAALLPVAYIWTCKNIIHHSGEGKFSQSCWVVFHHPSSNVSGYFYTLCQVQNGPLGYCRFLIDCEFHFRNHVFFKCCVTVDDFVDVIELEINPLPSPLLWLVEWEGFWIWWGGE